ncbi:copper homeostasis protein CutC [Mucilaginibacter polytrichastri]|uniref:PF03932 family protein CutC n=1 Tax=Mucilaginibacter polytrichastri TaxID=1302689 RepID=A0A1Q5ZZB1_9SPHI|nr:copper homeostasis protein CutC [Mucilaginibacter polytrichastri]OKS87100.1 Copper homeostasis protein CutC [Mucilaginibacter polytrichastri]SFS87459.1 copper homeostasis protein [Mucilaginibacter polytrichastri]
MQNTVTLEICANSVTSAIAAQQGGAARIELCENLKEAGTTPSYGQIILARKLLEIKIYTLIRPRAGDFLYNDYEFEIMLADVNNCINTGCDGVVIGMLKKDGSIDKERSGILADLARKNGLGVTFHRAFDVCNDYYQALEDIIDIGCERILTSGGKTTAMEGAGTIAHLVEKAAGRISIMAGSGVNEQNVRDLINFTGIHEVHTSAKMWNQSNMDYHNDYIMMGNRYHDLYTFESTNAGRVQTILANAQSNQPV